MGEHTLAAVLRRRAAERPQHPLLICDDERLDYGRAELRSADLARDLLALGAGRGTHVRLLYPNGADFVVGMLAAARSGSVVVPLRTFATARELGDQLRHSDTEILLAKSTFRNHDYGARLREVTGGAAPPGQRLLNPEVPHLRHVFVDRVPDGTVGDGLLTAVEGAILRVTGAQAHVLGLPDPVRFDADALRTALRNELSAFKIPRCIVDLRRADLPVMSSGKVDLPRLREVFHARR